MIDNNATHKRPTFAGALSFFYAAVLAAASMLGVCTTILVDARVDGLNRARDPSRNVALLVERDIVRNFKLYDRSMQAVIEGLRDPEVRKSSEHIKRLALFDRAPTARYIADILVIDAFGKITIDGSSDRPLCGSILH